MHYIKISYKTELESHDQLNAQDQDRDQDCNFWSRCQVHMISRPHPWILGCPLVKYSYVQARCT